jgi:hypothetical protein
MATDSAFTPSELALMDDFRAQVADKAHDVDPSGERDWADLAYGWFLAKGKTPNNAMDLVVELVRNRHL